MDLALGRLDQAKDSFAVLLDIAVPDSLESTAYFADQDRDLQLIEYSVPIAIDEPQAAPRRVGGDREQGLRPVMRIDDLRDHVSPLGFGLNVNSHSFSSAQRSALSRERRPCVRE